jgi:Recombination endonuclease VII
MRTTVKGAYDREYYKKHGLVLHLRAIAYYQKNRDRILAKGKARYYANHEEGKRQRLAKHFRQKYGLSLAEKDAILLKGCQICGLAATTIDHDHSSGVVRGGLCNNCNTGLGMFKDSPQVLQKAAEYLKGS